MNYTQTKILGFIRGFQFRNGYCPSLREIGEGADIKSTSAVHYGLVGLRKAGRIEFVDKINRTYRIAGSHYTFPEEEE